MTIFRFAKLPTLVDKYRNQAEAAEKS